MSKTTFLIEINHIPGDNKNVYDMVERSVHVDGVLEYSDSFPTRMLHVDKTPITNLNNWLLGIKTNDAKNQNMEDPDFYAKLEKALLDEVNSSAFGIIPELPSKIEVVRQIHEKIKELETLIEKSRDLGLTTKLEYGLGSGVSTRIHYSITQTIQY